MSEYYPGFREDFLNRTKHRSVVKNWFSTPAANQALNNAKKILSVGCGTGATDLHIAELLSPNNFKDIGVEPDSNMLNGFREYVKREKLAGKLKDTKFEFEEKTFEDYVHAGPQLDIVLMIHCLYYMPDRTIPMKKALEIGDKVLFVVLSEEAGMYQLQHKLNTEIDSQMICSKDVLRDLDKIECKYTLVGKIYETVDVNEPSDSLLKFFLENSNVDDTIIAEAKKYLKEKYVDGIMPHTADVYCVTKK